MVATKTDKQVHSCLERLVDELSNIDCKGVKASLEKCKGTKNIPVATTHCLQKAHSNEAVDACIGRSFNIKLSEHVSKGGDV